MKIGFKIETKKTVDFFKKIPRTIGEHFFLSFVFAALLAFLIGALIFYRFVFLTKNAALNILERPVFFNEDVYKKVLEEISNREKIIQELDSKQYSNPFASISSETGPIQPPIQP